jgi:hypothetical protein
MPMSICDKREERGETDPMEHDNTEILASIDETCRRSFSDSSGLTDLTFLADSRLRKISGFRRCTPLSRLEIPARAEMISPSTARRYCEYGALEDPS